MNYRRQAWDDDEAPISLPVEQVKHHDDACRGAIEALYGRRSNRSVTRTEEQSKRYTDRRAIEALRGLTFDSSTHRPHPDSVSIVHITLHNINHFITSNIKTYHITSYHITGQDMIEETTCIATIDIRQSGIKAMDAWKLTPTHAATYL
jgi:hypothetical protein